MLRKEHRIISFAAVMLCAIALSGCFGGGSGAGGGVAVGGFTTLFASVRSKAADNIEGPGQLSEAAHKVPNADGGVTQSANSGVSVVTTDSMTAAVTTDNGQIRYALTYTDSGGTVTVLDVEELNRGSGDGINFVELKDEDNNRTMYVDVYTDYEGDGDTDYLAAGLWAYVSSIDDTLLFGAFADGSDPFTQSNLEGLTGDATYDGRADGIYAVRAEGNATIRGDVTLTAAFGNASELGTIGGKIYNIHLDGVAAEGDPELTLGSANIGSSDRGFFTGDTSVTYDGSDFTGKWGGQFYGNDHSSGQPGSVAGTFGSAITSGRKSFFGVFGAYHQ